MSDRFLNLGGLAMVAVLVLIVQAPATGQTQRTPWGDPDLQGVYTYETATPMERPEQLGDKEFYTEAEIAEMKAELDEQNAARRAARATHRNAPPRPARAAGRRHPGSKRDS